MTRLRGLVLPAVAAMMVAALPASADVTQTERYELGGFPHIYPQCYLFGQKMSPSYGGACFLPPADASAITISITDSAGSVVAAVVRFAVGYDGEVVSPVFCGSIANLPVPQGTTGVNISTSPLGSAGSCVGSTPATSGVITAQYA